MYVYAWRGGPQIYKAPGRDKPKLPREAIRAIADAYEKREPRADKNLRSLIRRWRSLDPERPSSPEWDRLSKNTKKTWGAALDVIEDKWGDVPLAIFSDKRMKPKIVQWRDSRSATPRGADIGVTVLRELLKFGCLHGDISINAAEGIPTLYRGGDRAEIVWTDEDIDRFCWHALALNKPHLIDAVLLASLTGMRRADLVTVSFDNVEEHAIKKKALKVSRRKRRFVTIPRTPELNELLDELQARPRRPGVRTLLVSSRGEPWTEDGFGGSFNLVRDAAKIIHQDPETGAEKKKHLHDLRGTFATRLISQGLSDLEVAETMGWGTNRVADIRRVYVDQAAVIMAIGERIAAGTVNQVVNR